MREQRMVTLRSGTPAARTIAMEVLVRRLVTSAMMDAVTGAAVQPGPDIDETVAWIGWRRKHPGGRYAVGKRMLSRSELKRHGLRNEDPAA